MPGSACHFETADYPHVNESGSGGRVTGRGVPSRPQPTLGCRPASDSALVPRLSTFLSLVCTERELRSRLTGDLSPIASYKIVWILNVKAAE
jgi:hypothetical protein